MSIPATRIQVDTWHVVLKLMPGSGRSKEEGLGTKVSVLDCKCRSDFGRVLGMYADV